MNITEKLLVGFVALQHFAFFVLESILWGSDIAMKVFKVDAEKSAILAQGMVNQGVYNLFLTAGLIWALVNKEFSYQLKVFFLGCVIVAGLVGGFSVKVSILFVQGLPAAIALAIVYLNQKKN